MTICMNTCQALHPGSGPWQAFDTCGLLSVMERRLFQAKQDFVQGTESSVCLKHTKNRKGAAGVEMGGGGGGQGMHAKAAAETRPCRCSGHLQERLPVLAPNLHEDPPISE